MRRICTPRTGADGHHYAVSELAWGLALLHRAAAPVRHAIRPLSRHHLCRVAVGNPKAIVPRLKPAFPLPFLTLGSLPRCLFNSAPGRRCPWPLDAASRELLPSLTVAFSRVNTCTMKGFSESTYFVRDTLTGTFHTGDAPPTPTTSLPMTLNSPRGGPVSSPDLVGDPHPRNGVRCLPEAPPFHGVEGPIPRFPSSLLRPPGVSSAEKRS